MDCLKVLAYFVKYVFIGNIGATKPHVGLKSYQRQTCMTSHMHLNLMFLAYKCVHCCIFTISSRFSDILGKTLSNNARDEYKFGCRFRQLNKLLHKMYCHSFDGCISVYVIVTKISTD